MSLTATFYAFEKRRNSTKTPSIAGITGEDYSIYLKRPTSYKNPVFHIHRTDQGFGFNYFDWSGWLYFIDDVVSVGNDRYEIHGSLDVLGTLRAWIMATTAFVLYDTTSNSEIPDTRLSTKTVRGFASANDEFNSLGQLSDPSDGIVVLGITTKDGATFFAMDQSVAQSLLTDVNNYLANLFPTAPVSPGSGGTTEDYLEFIGDCFEFFGDVGQTFVERMMGAPAATSAITSAVQLPLTMGATHGNTQLIYLATFPTNKSAMELEWRVYVDTLTISIPWTFSDWRRRAPYTALYLYCPYFGLVALPTEELIGETAITIEATIDLPTGETIFEVYGYSTGYYIGTYSANIGGQYTVGSGGVSMGKQITTAIGATIAGAAIIASGGSAAAMAAKIGGAAFAGVIGGNTPNVSSISGGGGGASLGLRKKSYVFEVTHDTTVAPSSVSASIGTPAMEQKTLGSLTGFVQTRAASVAAPFYGDILEECNRLLDGGVFIE